MKSKRQKISEDGRSQSWARQIADRHAWTIEENRMRGTMRIRCPEGHLNDGDVYSVGDGEGNECEVKCIEEANGFVSFELT